MKQAPARFQALSCAGLGGVVGASTCAPLLAAWPCGPGVVWTPTELWELALIGACVGGLLGAVLSLGARHRTPVGAVVAGLLPAAVWAWIPMLPVDGRALLRVDPGAVGVLVGAALVVWGVVRLVRHPAVHALAAVLFVCVIALRWPPLSSPIEAAPAGPDLVLVTIDTTRADLVPGFGGDLAPAEMPFLSAWAEGSRRFTRAYAPTALTGPSHTSILSGQHVLQHGILANGRDIPPTVPLVPEQLQAAGWTTRGWTSAAVLAAHLGFGRGFDHYDSLFEQRLRYGHPLFQVLPRRRVGGTGFVREDAETVAHALSAPKTTGRTLTWVHLYGPHWPYTPTAEHAAAAGVDPILDTGPTGPVPLNHAADLPDAVRTHAIALYRAELRTLDDYLARLLGPLSEDTRVVVVADHGESLDEHGLLFNHGRLTTTPSTRVPLFVRGPGYPPGTDDRTVSLHQLAPTLLHLADLDPAPFGTPLHETPADAVSVSVASADVFGSEEAPPFGPLGAFAAVSIRSGDWSKSASQWHPAGWSSLSVDPRELAPKAMPADPASAQSTALETRWVDVVSQSIDAPTEVDAQTRAALEALGYSEP